MTRMILCLLCGLRYDTVPESAEDPLLAAVRRHIASFEPGTLIGSELNLAHELAKIDGDKWQPWLVPGEAEPDVPDSDGGWQDIETAPKDGTHIIVPGGTAHWSPSAQAWFSDQSQRFIEWPVEVWQPLPPPPRGKTEGE